MTPTPAVDFKARTISGVAALTVVGLMLLGPMLIYRVIAGIPLDARGPEWEGWLLVIGGGLGAGLGRYVHNRLMTRVFGSTDKQEKDAWGR